MKRMLICVAVFLACVGMVHAGQRADGASRRKAGPARRAAAGSEIVWHKSIDAAIAAAQKEKPQRPIFLLRLLGELDGKL